MTSKNSLVLTSIIILLSVAVMTSAVSDVYAVKSREENVPGRVGVKSYGSATAGIVCGDRLCSEVSSETKSQTKAYPLQSETKSPMLISTDMGKPVLYLINTNTDAMITVDLGKDPKWPGGDPLHSIITPDGSKVYLTLMSSDTDPLSIIAVSISDVNWNAMTAKVKITNVMTIENPGSKPSMLVPEQTSEKQPITSLWVPQNHQIHGPTILPNGKWLYTTQWTDNKIWKIDTDTDKLAKDNPIQIGTFTRQMHGVIPNSEGTIALGTGYYFDMDYLTVFDVDQTTGELSLKGIIPLTDGSKRYGALTHYVYWIDDRYAVTGAMQLGPTSLTPTGFEVIGPSIFLVDTKTNTSKLIIGPDGPNKDGLRQPPSDISVIGDKLYVAEEDSLDDEIDEEGYLSIWDISNKESPRLLKRMGSENGLPQEFHVGHGLYSIPGGKFIYLQDWESATLVKLDVRTDEILKVYDEDDGFIMPHGGFVVGNLR